MHNRLVQFLFSFFFLSLGMAGQAIAQAKTLRFEEGGVQITLSERAKGPSKVVAMTIQSDKHKKSAVFGVPDPSRIVIDLFDIRIKKDRSFKANDIALVNSVRLGAHHEKLRIVLDLKSAAIPAYHWSQTKDQISLSFEIPPKDTPAIEVATAAPIVIPTPRRAYVPSDTEITPVPVQEKLNIPEIQTEQEIQIDPLQEGEDVQIEDLIAKKPRSTPTKAPPTPTPAPTRTATSAPTSEPSATPTVPPAESAVVVQEQSAAALPLEFNAIDFVYGGAEKKRPIIRLSLSKNAEFDLQKSGPRSYLLKIKGSTRLKDTLKLAHFPPHDFVGFTMIQAAVNGDDIDVTIGTERNKRISATPKDENILIAIIEDERIEASSGKSKAPRAAPLRGR